MGEGTILKAKLKNRADVSECCKRDGSLMKVENPVRGSAVLQCSICGRRHHYMKADTGHLGMTLTSK